MHPSLSPARNRSMRAPEERANAATHALGAVLAIAAAPVAITSAAPTTQGGIAVFLAAMIAVFATSAVYHWFSMSRRRRLFLVADHAAIFALIAGTYTALAMRSLPAAAAAPLLTGIWLAALLGMGIAIAAFCAGCGALYERHCYLLHLLMGWGPLLVYGREIYAGLPLPAVVLIVAGCVAYSGGVAIYQRSRSRWGHAYWHVAVMVGAGLHGAALTL